MSTRTITRSADQTSDRDGGSITFDPTLMPIAREVAERDRLHADKLFIISRKAGKKLHWGKNPETGESFVHFGLQLDGKIVNFHVYDIPVQPGKSFRGEAQLMVKSMKDQNGAMEKYLHIDVRPTDSHPTHVLKFFNQKDALRDVPSLAEGSVIIKESFTNIVGVMALEPQEYVPYIPKHLRKAANT